MEVTEEIEYGVHGVDFYLMFPIQGMRLAFWT